VLTVQPIDLLQRQHKYEDAITRQG
jgi:hypothetical protein